MSFGISYEALGGWALHGVKTLGVSLVNKIGDVLIGNTSVGHLRIAASVSLCIIVLFWFHTLFEESMLRVLAHQ